MAARIFVERDVFMKKYSQLIRHTGNNFLFDLIDISILGTLANTPIHFHAEGLRGTGKTTIIRAAKDILPKIKRIKGCIYNCDPSNPHCPEHRDLSNKDIEQLGTELIDMPFLEISPSAKKGTVVGSIDLKKISSREEPEAALLLGTIPRAHRGIIFVDEINRIADTSPELADILLDVMGTKPGRIQIEEVGLPTVVIPVQVSIWAASNPDEEPGPLEDIRRQLSDRFDFTVNVERPVDTAVLKMILDGNNEKYNDSYLIEEKKEKLLRAQAIIDDFSLSDEIKSILASMYVDFGLESLRSIEAIMLGAKIRGALLGKNPDIGEIIFLARLALRHRMDAKNLNELIKHLEQRRHQPEKKSEAAMKSNDCDLRKAVLQKNNDQKIGTNSGKLKNKFFSPLEKMMSILTNKFSSSAGGKNNRPLSSDPKDMDIKAPSKKAISLKQLELKDYVKKEEELRR